MAGGGFSLRRLRFKSAPAMPLRAAGGLLLPAVGQAPLGSSMGEMLGWCCSGPVVGIPAGITAGVSVMVLEPSPEDWQLGDGALRELPSGLLGPGTAVAAPGGCAA